MVNLPWGAAGAHHDRQPAQSLSLRIDFMLVRHIPEPVPHPADATVPSSFRKSG
jgi:hypothetical protein